jgi:EAL domain-containing protein (putative c-di-GMP-specific phosphodiesterase class I)
MQRMQCTGAPPLPIAVNVSYREYARHRFTDRVAAILAKCGLQADNLELELREAGLNNNHHLGIEVLSQLQDMGVRRSVDAFGDGVCDLNFLQKLPLTHLKLARKAVHQITADVRSGAVCKALIDIGHDLGVQVIAKGVETQVQMDFLRQNSCDELQGMVFSAPMDEASMHDLLATSAVG